MKLNKTVNVKINVNVLHNQKISTYCSEVQSINLERVFHHNTNVNFQFQFAAERHTVVEINSLH